MGAEGDRYEQTSTSAGQAGIVRMARQKIAELAALLDQLAPLSGCEPESLGPGSAVVATMAAPHKAGPVKLGSHDMLAYRLWQLAGMRQVDIAIRLNGELGTTYCQGQISRMIRRACVHMRNAGIPIVSEHAGRVRTIDPHLLDLGARTDGRPTDGRRSRPGNDEL